MSSGHTFALHRASGRVSWKGTALPQGAARIANAVCMMRDLSAWRVTVGDRTGASHGAFPSRVATEDHLSLRGATPHRVSSRQSLGCCRPAASHVGRPAGAPLEIWERIVCANGPNLAAFAVPLCAVLHIGATRVR
jgi:hypothetical protein